MLLSPPPPNKTYAFCILIWVTRQKLAGEKIAAVLLLACWWQQQRFYRIKGTVLPFRGDDETILKDAKILGSCGAKEGCLGAKSSVCVRA